MGPTITGDRLSVMYTTASKVCQFCQTLTHATAVRALNSHACFSPSGVLCFSVAWLRCRKMLLQCRRATLSASNNKQHNKTALAENTQETSLYMRNKQKDQPKTMRRQSVMAALAGYFGGYTSKMQPIGESETKQLREAAQRRVAGEASEGQAKYFNKYVRRMLKDLEMRGTIRTSAETTNLSLHANNSDVLKGECIRTFPHVNFPASLLLKREEIETLLSPYEMLLPNSMERVSPPTSQNKKTQ